MVGVFFAFFELGREVLGFLFFGLVALVAGAFGAECADAGHFGWMDGWVGGVGLCLMGII